MNKKYMKYHTAKVYFRRGRIRVRPALHLKSAVGYRRGLISRIELDLLRAALLG